MSYVNEDHERTKAKEIGGTTLHGEGYRRLDANVGANFQVRDQLSNAFCTVQSPAHEDCQTNALEAEGSAFHRRACCHLGAKGVVKLKTRRQASNARRIVRSLGIQDGHGRCMMYGGFHANWWTVQTRRTGNHWRHMLRPNSLRSG